MRAKAGKDKKDKTKDEYEYEKGKEECTFQPNIQKSEIIQSYGSQRYGDSQFFATVNGDLDITQHIKGY